MIEKEPKRPKAVTKARSSTPPKERGQGPQQYVSIRRRIQDESRDARIEERRKERETPGPGQYHSKDLPFGSTLCKHAPAISRLQCFGTTESRNSFEPKRRVVVGAPTGNNRINR